MSSDVVVTAGQGGRGVGGLGDDDDEISKIDNQRYTSTYYCSPSSSYDSSRGSSYGSGSSSSSSSR